MHIFDGQDIKSGEDITFMNSYGAPLRHHHMGNDYIGRAMYCHQRIDNPANKYLNGYYAVDKIRFGKYHQTPKQYGQCAIPSKLTTCVDTILTFLNPAFHNFIPCISDYITIDIYRKCPKCWQRGIELDFTRHLDCLPCIPLYRIE